MNRITTKFMVALAMLMCFTTNVFAASEVPISFPETAIVSQETIQTKNGDEIIITIEEYKEAPSRTRAAAQTKSGVKTWEYKSASGVEWTYSVTGKFTFNGRTAKATGSTGTPSIKKSGWACTKNSATYSGATAKASGTFKRSAAIKNANVSLTCSANGGLS